MAILAIANIYSLQGDISLFIRHAVGTKRCLDKAR